MHGCSDIFSSVCAESRATREWLGFQWGDDRLSVSELPGQLSLSRRGRNEGGGRLTESGWWKKRRTNMLSAKIQSHVPNAVWHTAKKFFPTYKFSKKLYNSLLCASKTTQSKHRWKMLEESVILNTGIVRDSKRGSPRCDSMISIFNIWRGQGNRRNSEGNWCSCVCAL